MTCYGFQINSHNYSHLYTFFFKWVNFSLEFQGEKVYNGKDGMTVGKGGRKTIFHPQEAKGENTILGNVLNNQSPPQWCPSSSRSVCLLKDPSPPQTALSTGKQVFKYMSLWGNIYASKHNMNKKTHVNKWQRYIVLLTFLVTDKNVYLTHSLRTQFILVGKWQRQWEAAAHSAFTIRKQREILLELSSLAHF